jgi:electron transfer flavoprotein alpha subunit
MATQERSEGGILAFSEHLETAGELLTAGRELATRLKCLLVAVATGPDDLAMQDDLLTRGADQILLVRDALGAQAGTESVPHAVREAVRVSSPAVVLMGATRSGNETAARVAQMLQMPCASSCVSIEADDEGRLIVERRIYGGRFVSRQRLAAAPALLTVPPRRFARAQKADGARSSVRELMVDLPAPRIRTVGVTERARSQVDISKAEVIVCAGRGVKRMEDLEQLERLARLLGGVLAGSRPLTGDVDWLPPDRRIGLSGQTVKPNLYIACGVSGAIEHIVGMKGARTVVAINNDVKAPIHGEADYSVIGDLYEIVPALIRACENARRGPA